MNNRDKIFIPWGRLIFIFTIVIFLGIVVGIIVARIAVHHQKEVEVPNIVRWNVVDALEEVNKKKLNLEISDKCFDSSIPIDYIISQEPQAGENVKAGRVVRIVVSRGIKQTTVPNVENIPLREAQGFLRRNGWIIARVSFIPSPYMEEGKIIAQTPLPDSEVLLDTKISLLVSSGQQKGLFYMPDLIGRDISEVKKLIKELDLIVGDIKEEENSDWDKDIVLDQNPPAGYAVSVGDTVDVKVNILEKKEEEGIKSRIVFVSYVMPAGLVDRQIKILVLDERGENEVFNQSMGPGEKIKISVHVWGEGRAKIFLDEELVEERGL